MIEPNNPILTRMLDRLFAAMLNGPSMNCRPHASRQRLDLVQLCKLRDIEPGDVLLALLGKEPNVKLTARVPVPTRKITGDESASKEQVEAYEAWADQQHLRTKLRVVADDARTYEQDTGVHALHLGFPLLSLPPGTFGGGARGAGGTRRVLAPIAFVPVAVAVGGGAAQTVRLACRGEGMDLVVPNTALLAWLEQQTGKSFEETFQDET